MQHQHQGVAIRCRKVKEICGGPKYEEGWFIGKTVSDAVLNNQWSNGIVIGCDDPVMNYFDDDEDDDGVYNGVGAAGIMGDPKRLLDPEDTLIFVSDTSSPQVKRDKP